MSDVHMYPVHELVIRFVCHFNFETSRLKHKFLYVWFSFRGGLTVSICRPLVVVVLNNRFLGSCDWLLSYDLLSSISSSCTHTLN